MFWSLPPEMSKQIYEKYQSGENAVYTWSWGGSREDTWRPDDKPTPINRYIIDFDTMAWSTLKESLPPVHGHVAAWMLNPAAVALGVR